MHGNMNVKITMCVASSGRRVVSRRRMDGRADGQTWQS